MDIKMLKAISDGAQVMAAQAEEMAVFAAGMAEGAKQMAESMRAVVEDCARQIRERRAAGVTEEAAMNEAFESIKPNASAQPQNCPSGALQPTAPTTGAPEAESRPVTSGTAKANMCSPEDITLGTEADETLDLVTLRAFVASRSSPENRAKIKAILRKYGAEKLTELNVAAYAAVKAEVAQL
ncbi:MAG: hypothetical protein Q4F18_09930 [Clostridia bacterium]|nr:hypothetical protein [Clostridia bacterium]